MNGKVQPQALDLEVIVIGAILLEESAFNKVVEIITEHTFYSRKNQLIFKACKTLKVNNDNIDMYSVVEQLRKTNDLETVGGAYHIAELTNKVASSAHIENHSRILKEKELRRELIAISNKAIQNAYDDTVDTFENIITTSLDSSKLLEFGSNKKIEKLNDLIIENHKNRLLPKEGQKSKFDNLPDYQKGKLYIIAGRPAMGKTTFAINEAYNFSKQSNVLIFSLEMESNEIAAKIEALESKIPTWRIEKNKIYQKEEQAYEKLRLLNTNLFIDDTPAIDLTHIKTKATKLKKDEELSMIVIDYLQLMKGDTKGNREQEISSITRGLKELAKYLQVPIIALSQLSREVEKRGSKRPMLSDLRESGSIEQDADLVGFLFRPYYYAEQSGDVSAMGQVDKNLAEYIIAKNRGGKVGTHELRCNLEISEFSNKQEFTDSLTIDEDPPF